VAQPQQGKATTVAVAEAALHLSVVVAAVVLVRQVLQAQAQATVATVQHHQLLAHRSQELAVAGLAQTPDLLAPAVLVAAVTVLSSGAGLQALTRRPTLAVVVAVALTAPHPLQHLPVMAVQVLFS